MEIDVRRIAELSKLELKEEQVEMFQKQMQNMVDMVEKMPEVAELEAPLDRNNAMILRKDEIHSSLRREDLLKNAPQVEAGCFVVPKVVE